MKTIKNNCSPNNNIPTIIVVRVNVRIKSKHILPKTKNVSLTNILV
jgi:hypothetical protein